AAEITGADAIHPGYGFLAENADFAQMVEEHGHIFIGPTPEHIRVMGDKIAAKRAAAEAGLPVVPGTDEAINSERAAMRIAEDIGYPVLIKAVAGGGGRGMHVVRDPSGLLEALKLARREAKSGFGDDRVYIEKFLDRPRHIEVQVLADGHGQCVHLFERDCSLQRRHQKVIEEAPSAVLDRDGRMALGERVVAAMHKLGYRGVGTVEFLYADGAFYFIEMNTRLQVEHPVTELVTGIDLVREQIKVATGAPLGLRQSDIRLQGHAIECRITAEDPATLVPSAGTVSAYHPPGGIGVRVDSALYAGYAVPPYYDSLIAKLVVHGDDRDECIRRTRRALGEYVISGVPNSIPLLLELLGHEAVQAFDYDTGWLGRYLETRGAMQSPK
ncbi:MAG: acetyl/propionyl/methylcrotonyl-CoA carboxylase subunit alpha, partial [Geminicoccaceae bacterium]